MEIRRESFGRTRKGEETHLYILENKKGMRAVVCSYGATLVSLFVPNQDGVVEDVVLGYDTLEEYEKGICYFGSTIGRSGNRIADSSFSIDGISYQMDANENKNNLHSGPKGYDRIVWDCVTLDEEKNLVEFSRISPHLEQGFPGEFKISVTYTLTEENSLEIHYEGESDQSTIANLTNHSYFNLEGGKGGSVLRHRLCIQASYYTPVENGQSIPNGRIEKVAGTPMDFRQEKEIGRDLEEAFEQLRFTGGYDHNYVVDDWNQAIKKIAKVTASNGKRSMEVYTDLPGVQFYAGNFIGIQKGKAGNTYNNHSGFCLETQYFPNAINEKNFPSPIIKAGERYSTTTIYRFF